MDNLVPDPHVAVRAAFKSTFQRYSDEFAKMQEIRLSLAREPEEARASMIDAQQKRIDEALSEYETARQQYMRDVLDLNTSLEGLPICESD